MQYLISVLCILCFAAAIILAVSIYTARTLKVSHIRRSDRYTVKALHISDLHINLTQISAKKLQNKVLIISPDVIFITGDLAQHAKNLPRAVKYLKTVCGSIPTYLCLGNHEYKAFKEVPGGVDVCVRQLAEAGFFCVRNGCFECKVRDVQFNVVMLDDKRCGKPDTEAAFANAIPGKGTVALCHHPDTALEILFKKPDLILCGHFHGGQVHMPFGVEYRHFKSRKMLDMGHAQGLMIHENISVYISRGVGNVIVPFRLGSFPEIAVFYLNF